MYIYCIGVCEMALDCTGITVPFLFFTPLIFCSRYTFFLSFFFYITGTYIIKTLRVRVYYYIIYTVPQSRQTRTRTPPPTRWPAPDDDGRTRRVSVLFLCVALYITPDNTMARAISCSCDRVGSEGGWVVSVWGAFTLMIWRDRIDAPIVTTYI